MSTLQAIRLGELAALNGYTVSLGESLKLISLFDGDSIDCPSFNYAFEFLNCL